MIQQDRPANPPLSLIFATCTETVKRPFAALEGGTYDDDNYWAGARPSGGEDENIWIAENYAKQTYSVLKRDITAVHILAKIAEDQIPFRSDPNHLMLINEFWRCLADLIWKGK